MSLLKQNNHMMTYLMRRFFKQKFEYQSTFIRTRQGSNYSQRHSFRTLSVLSHKLYLDNENLFAVPLSAMRSFQHCCAIPKCQLTAGIDIRRGFAKQSSNIRFKKLKSPDSAGKGKKRVVAVSGPMTVQKLQEAMGVHEDHIYEFLLATDVHADLSPNKVLKPKVIQDIVTAADMQYVTIKKEKVEPQTIKDAIPRPPADPSLLKPRSPVVTIMGHVDHGKTTLLDTLRKTSVAAGEAGGITQHIGAFQVKLPSGQVITFLDTPGHAAFKAMRERGGMVTDIVVLVVAADDGVMEQTKESIQYARTAGVPIIVAVNKCDKPDADPDFTKRDLLGNDIILEEFGGDVQCVEISALKGTNLDALCEAIMTQAELQELKADPTGLVEAVILESKVDKGIGPAATLIVQRGTLKKGAILVAGTATCRVRAMYNERGEQMKETLPSRPVEVTGWRDTPAAGDLLLQLESEKRAKEVVKWRQEEMSTSKLREDVVAIERKSSDHQREYDARRQAHSKMHWREIRAERVIARFTREKEMLPTGDPELNLVIKGDVDGSVEAILDALSTYTSHQCKLNILNFGVGVLSDKDVELAQTFSGAVVGFNVAVTKEAEQLAKQKAVPIKMHNVIYRLLDDVKEDLNSRLPLKEEQSIIGEATVLQPFQISVGKRKVNVAGCRVNKGELQSRGYFRLVRNQDTIHEGPVASLKHLKDDVTTVKSDTECGVRFEEQLEYKQGDIIICYEILRIPQEIEWDLGF